jgi:hypothetical protein
MEAVTHNFCPHAASLPAFANFFKEIDMGIEKERKTRRKFINIETLAADNVFDIFNAVANRES